MKILYASPVFLDYRIPFFKELKRLFGGDFHVMYSPNRYRLIRREDLTKRIPEELGDNAHPFEHDYLFDTATMSFRKMNYEHGQKITFMRGFLRAIRRVKPDVLITEAFFQWTPWGIAYHLIHGVPLYISYERTCHTERNAGRLKTWHRKLSDRFIKGYLVNGVETARYLRSIGVRQEKIHCIGMSADSEGLRVGIAALSDEEKQRFKSRFVREGRGIVYLFTGQVVERKGIVPLLETWMEYVKKHPMDSMVVVGGGDLLDVCKSRFGSEPSVYLEGRVAYAEIYKYYAVADVFVLPTIEDNWSLVVPEAMACGLPVATSIYNGCHPELIREGENGVTFDTFKQESIIRALDYFHHQDLKAMGQRSMEIEKEYDTEHCAKRAWQSITKDNNV